MFHFDLDAAQMESFDIFLVKFEAMMVQTIIDNRVTLMGEDKQLSIQQIIDVATRFYDRNLLEQGLAHSINRVLSG